MEEKKRFDGRSYGQIRPITIQYDVYGYADASVLFEIGGTKVLAGVTLQQGVPAFLRGQRVGWLTAEYSILPIATHHRIGRESSQSQRNSRSVEISRLIGRCLRSTIDLSFLGERTIIVDCDVLEADGGTRVACVTAASIALKLATMRWQHAKIIESDIFNDQIAAISVGIVDGEPCTDLSYREDSNAGADFNFIVTTSQKVVEIQGTCEKKAISWESFDDLKVFALKGITELLKQCSLFPIPSPSVSIKKELSVQSIPSRKKIQSNQYMFSLGSRLDRRS